MSDVIAIRVPKKLKDELNELGLDYAEDIREHLERMVKRTKLRKVMKGIDEFRNGLGKKVGMTASSAHIIREDREHGH